MSYSVITLLLTFKNMYTYRNKSGLTRHRLECFNKLHDIQYPIDQQTSGDMWGNRD